MTTTSLKPSADGGAMWKWWICITLLLATVLSYLDRQTMAICAPAISQEFGLSNEGFGGLLAAFRWTYALAQIPAGWLADRFAVRTTYALAVGFWSLAGAAASCVFSVRVLAVTRGLLGVGEAFNAPCALRVTADILPPEDRGLGNGLFNSGAALGALIAPWIIAPVAIRWGWRTAFLLVGTAGGLWIVVWWITTRGHRSLTHTHGASGPESASSRDCARGVRFREVCMLLRQPAFWLLAVTSMTLNPCWYFCADWIPKYMYDQRGFSSLTAGLIATPIFLAADLGNIVGGWTIKWLADRTWPVARARAAVVVVAAMFILPVGMATHVSDPYVSIALLALAAFGLMAMLVSYLASLQEISFARVGFVSGILGALGNVMGAVASPLIGRYVDQSGHYHIVFALIAVLPLVSAAGVVAADILMARIRRISG